MKPFTDQIALTVIARIRDADLTVLHDRLTGIQNGIDLISRGEGEKALLPFSRINGVHFCRFVILPAFADTKGRQVPPQLAYSANIDGPLEAHLNEIAASGAAAGFAAAFSCCTGYNTAAPEAEAVQAFIRKNRKTVHTFYRAYRGLSVDIIRSEDLLYQTIQAHLQGKSFSGQPVAVVKKDIEAHIALALPDRKAGEVIGLPDYSLLKTGLLLLAQLVLPLVLILLAACRLHLFWYTLAAITAMIAAAAAYLRYLENSDDVLPDTERNYDRIRKLAEMEDKIVQNQLTHLVVVKKGPFRRALQWLALQALNKLAVYSFNKGRLGGIGTIHFARWSIIDGGERLLFFSNFDGSWEAYLGDFVDRASLGLTLAWSNTVEFPRSKWLVKDGAKNEALFKSWARKYQQPTQVWYSAYKNLTVSNIYRNHRIALGLGKPMSDDEINAWLKLL